jgi:hypothetical protein
MTRSAKLNITPDLIPHSEFHQGVWLLPVKGAGWYYFMRKKNPNTIGNKTFLKSVDGPLRELVRFLHQRKIKTTPSCAGHHISDNGFKKIYRALVRDQEQIRNAGLELKDIESGKTFIYRNPHYHLPWSMSTFIKRMAGYQKKGVIGIKLGRNKRFREKMMSLQIPNTTIAENNSVLLIITRNDQKRSAREVWKKVTEHIKSIVAEDPIMRNIFSSEYRTGSARSG